MPKRFYDRVGVRDGLAAERTVLAAERTFLAYVRSAFAMFVAGVSGAHLLSHPALKSTGYVLTLLSIGVFVVGIFRFRASLKETRKMLRRLESANDPG